MRKVYIIICIVTLAFTGCSDDFLNTPPQTQIVKENYFTSEEHLQLYLNGLHSLSGYGLFLSDQGTDDIATTGAVEIKNVMVGTPTAENIGSGWNWGYLRNINFFLENFDKADINEDAKKHYEGVARYYRAQFYFSKVKRFSDVPWYGKTLSTTNEDLYKPRDPRTLVVDSIIKDIQFASNNIREQVDLGNIHKWAAVMLQARIALYEGTYRKYHPELGLEGTANNFLQIARDAAKELMDSGEFSLHGTGNTNTDYWAMFHSEDLSNNSEAILVNVYDTEKNRFSGSGTVFGDFEQSPSKALINSYLMTDGTRFTDQAGANTMTYVEEFQNRDPRLSQTFVYPGWIRAGNPLPYIPVFNRNFTGYYQTKGYNNTTEGAGVDVAVYRYAEALLIYAEAKAELEEISQSDLDASINLLRARVGLPDLNLVMANGDVDPIMAARFPNVSGSNQGLIFEIRRERRVEYAAEGMRFDDLMRWAAGKVLENIPVGMYFPGLGNYDMTGDGIEDIAIIASGENIPVPKEQNALGVDLIYYKAGSFGDSGASIYLSEGTSGNMVTDEAIRTFIEPKYYYRPIPQQQVDLNPNLTQIMGW